MRILLVAGLLSLAPIFGQAQGTDVQDSVHLRNNCRLAAQVIRTGHPAPRLEWAYSQIPACGAEGGEALAARLRELRSSRDTGTIRALTMPFAVLRDRNAFDASLEIAGDKGASDVVRAYAFRNLVWLISDDADPAFTPWDARGLGCVGFVTDRNQSTGAPLNPDYSERIKELARRVATDTTEPSAARYGARCVLKYARMAAQTVP